MLTQERIKTTEIGKCQATALISFVWTNFITPHPQEVGSAIIGREYF